MASMQFVFEFLLKLFLWLVATLFGFTIAGVLVGRVKVFLINENIMRPRRFAWWLRTILLIPIIFSSIFLRLAGFQNDAYWLSLTAVGVVTAGTLYYPQTIVPFANLLTALLDQWVAAGNRLWRFLRGKK